MIDGQDRGQGSGSAKKVAEQRAAADAYERLQAAAQSAPDAPAAPPAPPDTD
jgi:dsRNA-specific ribonuclease